MRLMLSAVMAALLLAAPGPGFAATDPEPSPVDPRVRYLTFERDEVYKLSVSFNWVLTIVFDPDDPISSLQAGDTNSWQFDLLESDNVIVVKAKDEGGQTNLTVISESGRIYTFEMIPVSATEGRSEDLVYRVHFVYPDAAAHDQKRREHEARERAERERLARLQQEAEARKLAEAREEEERARREAEAARQAELRASDLAHQQELQRIAADRETQLAILREQQALEHARLREERERAEAERQAAEAARLAEEARKREEQRANSPTLLFDDGRAGIAAASARSSSSPLRRRRRSDNELFLAEAYEASFPTSTASLLPRQNRLVAQGTIIQAVLETAMNSDLPGMIRAVVNEDVYSFDGSALMIPKGSRLIGRYSSRVELGQDRILAVWTRLIRTDGVSIALGSPASDDLGVSGITGNVDTHFAEKFGSAALISVMSGFAVYGANQVQDDTGRDTAEAVGDDLTGNFDNAFERYLALAPTIRVDQGSRVSVFVARDLFF